MAPKQEPDRKRINAAFRLKPIVKDAAGALHFIRPLDIHAHLDDADIVKPLKESWDGKYLGETTIDIPAGLREFYGPTAAQVLEQVPPEFRRKATAYTVAIRDGSYSGEDMSVPARVVFYGGKLPQAVKDQPVIAKGKKYAAPILSDKQRQFIETAQTAKPVQIMKPIVFRKPEAPGAAP